MDRIGLLGNRYLTKVGSKPTQENTAVQQAGLLPEGFFAFPAFLQTIVNHTCT
jgi:hypothetical protein